MGNKSSSSSLKMRRKAKSSASLVKGSQTSSPSFTSSTPFAVKDGLKTPPVQNRRPSSEFQLDPTDKPAASVVSIEGIEGVLRSPSSSTSSIEHRLHQSALRKKPQPQEQKEQKWKYKILVVGDAQAGKSTFVKQLRLLYGQGIEQKERHVAAALIATELVSTVDEILDEMDCILQVGFESMETQRASHLFQRLLEQMGLDNLDSDWLRPDEEGKGKELRLQMIECIQAMAKDPNFRQVLSERTSSAIYFIQHVERIFQDGYEPLDDDLLHLYIPTIVPISYRVGVTNLEDLVIMDTGGQLYLQEQWIDIVNSERLAAIVYVASLTDYERIAPDNKANAFLDSLISFEKITNHKRLEHVPLFLILNKKDQLPSLCQRTPIQTVFQDYNGKPGLVEDTVAYLKSKYTLFQKTKREDLFHLYLLEATNTKQSKALWKLIVVSVMDYWKKKRESQPPQPLLQQPTPDVTATAITVGE